MKGKSKGKGKGKGGKDTQCWHCGKYGHIARDCWQKDAEMEEYRKGKGKGKGEAWGKGKGGEAWGKGKGVKGGNAWGKGSGSGSLFWFDQPGDMGQQVQPAWAFAVNEKFTKTNRPPGLPPPIVTANRWSAFATSDANEEEWPHVRDAAFTPQTSKTRMRGRVRDAVFTPQTSRTKKKEKAQEKEDEACMQKFIKQNEHAYVFTAKEKPVEANMVQGPWRRAHSDGNAEWIRVQSVMDSGCGCSVAPPGMCPSYPIHESAGSLRGQEFTSASEHDLPNLGEQVLNVVMEDGNVTELRHS
jgi:hypothetical protein